MLLSLTIYVAFAFLSIQLCGGTTNKYVELICKQGYTCSSNSDCLKNEVCSYNKSSGCGSCIQIIENKLGCNINNSCLDNGNCESPNRCIVPEGEKCGICTNNLLEMQSFALENTSIHCRKVNKCSDDLDCADNFTCHNYSNRSCGDCILNISQTLKNKQTCLLQKKCLNNLDCLSKEICYKKDEADICGICKLNIKSNNGSKPLSVTKHFQMLTSVMSITSHKNKVKRSDMKDLITCPSMRFCYTELDCNIGEECAENLGLLCGVCRNKITNSELSTCECLSDKDCPADNKCHFLNSDCGTCMKKDTKPSCNCRASSDCLSGDRCIIPNNQECGICVRASSNDIKNSPHNEILGYPKSEKEIASSKTSSEIRPINNDETESIQLINSDCNTKGSCKTFSDCPAGFYCKKANELCGKCETLKLKSLVSADCYRDCLTDEDCPPNFICSETRPNSCNVFCIKRKKV